MPAEREAAASSGAAVLPLDAFEPSAAERNTLTRAISALTAECMTAHGFTDYRPSNAAPPETTSLTRRYGVMSADDAARFGYHLTDAEKIGFRGPDDGEEEGAPDEVSEAEETALYGAPFSEIDPAAPLTSGCYGEAAVAVYGDSAEMPMTANLLAYELHGDSYSDDRVIAAIDDWSMCMQGQGYDVAGPKEAMDAADLSLPEPSAAEIAMASADIVCKDDTDLVEVWLTVEIELHNAAIEEQFETLTEERAQIDAMLTRAAEVLM